MKQLCLLGMDGAECRMVVPNRARAKSDGPSRPRKDFTCRPGNNGEYRHVLGVVATK